MSKPEGPYRPPLRLVLFALLFAGGLVPLALLDVLVIGAVSRAGRQVETALLVAAPVLLLALVAWVSSGWAARRLLRPLGRYSAGLARLRRGELDTWVSPGGEVREIAELSEGLNRVSATTSETVRRLRREARDAETLATDAMRLFRQAVQAREPLTKHHPGLLEAYTEAVTRQLAETSGELESAEIAMSPFERSPEAEPEPADRRAEPRFGIGDLVLSGPIGARIVDVSAVGLGLETMERLTVGHEARFELAARARRLRIPGSPVWCRLVRTVATASGDRVPVYRAGVRFAAAFSHADRDELLEIAQTHRDVA